MNFENYHIPANFTDAGKLLGMFPVRNTIESLLIATPLTFLGLIFLPFEITTRIIITMVAVIPTGGIVLIGINDDCLTRFLRIWWCWRINRRILTFRGSPDQKDRRDAQWT